MARTDLSQHIISPRHNTRRSLTILLWTDITSQATSLQHASKADDRAQLLATSPVTIHQQPAPMIISRSRAAAASMPMRLHSSTRKLGIPWILSPSECLHEVAIAIGRFVIVFNNLQRVVPVLTVGFHFSCIIVLVVTAFNEGEKTTDETLQEVSKIVQDRALNQRFRDLIHKAIAEKENQLENGEANETMDGDMTLEIDHSLLLDEDENRIVEGDEDLAEDERDNDLRDRNRDSGSDERFHEDNNSLERNDSSLTGGNEEDELLNHARDGDSNELDDPDQSRLNIEGPSLLIADGEGLQGMVDSGRSGEWSGKPGH